MKKYLFAFAAVFVCLTAGCLAFFFYEYHAQPELVKEVICSPELPELAPGWAFYDNETADKLFEQQGIKPRYSRGRPMRPLILRGKKIKTLSAEMFYTDNVTFELISGDPDTFYFYYVSERYNNFLRGTFL